MAKIEGTMVVKTDWDQLIDSFRLEEWLSRPIRVAPESADDCTVFRPCGAALRRALEMEAADGIDEPTDTTAAVGSDHASNHPVNRR